MKRFIFTAIVAAAGACVAWSQSEMRLGSLDAANAAGVTPAAVFADAPAAVFPTIDRMTRLDMLDYFNSGSDKPSKNALAGNARVLSLSDSQITVETSGAQTVEISLLPQKSDTLLVVVTTIKTPVADSSVDVYTSAWKPAGTGRFTAPGLEQWMLPEAKDQKEDLENLYPFTLTSATFDPQTGVLTLTNNLGEYLPEIESKGREKLLRSSLSYRWNGKRFDPIKK